MGLKQAAILQRGVPASCPRCRCARRRRESQIMIADLAILRFAGLAGPSVVAAEATLARFAPKKPSPPATRNVRRSIGEWLGRKSRMS